MAAVWLRSDSFGFRGCDHLGWQPDEGNLPLLHLDDALSMFGFLEKRFTIRFARGR